MPFYKVAVRWTEEYNDVVLVEADDEKKAYEQMHTAFTTGEFDTSASICSDATLEDVRTLGEVAEADVEHLIASEGYVVVSGDIE